MPYTACICGPAASASRRMTFYGLASSAAAESHDSPSNHLICMHINFHCGAEDHHRCHVLCVSFWHADPFCTPGDEASHAHHCTIWLVTPPSPSPATLTARLAAGRLLRMRRSFQVVPAMHVQPSLLPCQGDPARLLLRLDLHSAQVLLLPSCYRAVMRSASCLRLQSLLKSEQTRCWSAPQEQAEKAEHVAVSLCCCAWTFTAPRCCCLLGAQAGCRIGVEGAGCSPHLCTGVNSSDHDKWLDVHRNIFSTLFNHTKVLVPHPRAPGHGSSSLPALCLERVDLLALVLSSGPVWLLNSHHHL